MYHAVSSLRDRDGGTGVGVGVGWALVQTSACSPEPVKGKERISVVLFQGCNWVAQLRPYSTCSLPAENPPGIERKGSTPAKPREGPHPVLSPNSKVPSYIIIPLNSFNLQGGGGYSPPCLQGRGLWFRFPESTCIGHSGRPLKQVSIRVHRREVLTDRA